MMVGFGFAGLLVMLVFWGGLILGAVWLVKVIFQSSGRNLSEPVSSGNAREILDQRYARGEITRDQYEKMREDLQV
ncbi:MAG: SHOCT domain-containing protein [Anaerolineales bacterium]|nr:SHOCT domain-containing protein [Anaerolineales bacterium]